MPLWPIVGHVLTGTSAISRSMNIVVIEQVLPECLC